MTIGIVEEVIEQKIKEAEACGIKGYYFDGTLLYRNKPLEPTVRGGLSAFNYLTKLIDAAKTQKMMLEKNDLIQREKNSLREATRYKNKGYQNHSQEKKRVLQESQTNPGALNC